MTRRLTSIFAVMVAMLVCVASSQAAVCELSCGLESQNTACHLAAVSRSAAMQAMPHSHCSAAMSPGTAIDDSIKAVSNARLARCGHSSLAALETPAGLKLHPASGQWPLMEGSSIDQWQGRKTSLLHIGPPPLRGQSSHRLVGLRI